MIRYLSPLGRNKSALSLRVSVSRRSRSQAGCDSRSSRLYFRSYIGMYGFVEIYYVSAQPLRLAVVKEQSSVDAIHPRGSPEARRIQDSRVQESKEELIYKE